MVVSTTASAGTATATVESNHGCSDFAGEFAISSVVPLDWIYLGTANVERGSALLTGTRADFRTLPSNNPLKRGYKLVIGHE